MSTLFFNIQALTNKNKSPDVNSEYVKNKQRNDHDK